MSWLFKKSQPAAAAAAAPPAEKAGAEGAAAGQAAGIGTTAAKRTSSASSLNHHSERASGDVTAAALGGATAGGVVLRPSPADAAVADVESGDGGEADGSGLPPSAGHARRSTVNGDALVSDCIPPNDLEEAMLAPPPFLRGNMLKLFTLKQQALGRVRAIISGPGGLQQRFGFQGGEKGSAACSIEGLVSDLSGGAGPVLPLDMAVAELHEKVFENHNRWARMVGAQPLYSVTDDPDKKALLAERQRILAEITAISRNCGLAPTAPGGAAVAVEIGSVVGVDPQGRQVLAGGEMATHSTSLSGLSEASGTSTGGGSAGQGEAVITIGGVTIRAPMPEGGADMGDGAGGGADADGTPAPPVDSTGGSTGAGEGDSDAEADREKERAAKKKQKRKRRKQAEEGGEACDAEAAAAAVAACDPAIAAGQLPEYAPTVVSTQPGSDTHTRLVDLCLYYCIRTEAANLRFMPELLCWLFHQMRHLKSPPPDEEVHKDEEANPETSFFQRTTVVPLYQHLKKAARKDRDVSDSCTAVICCCHKLGRKQLIKNSCRPNYDDFNEWFWEPACLAYTYHTLDPEAGVGTIPPIRKTFREKSSYTAIILSFWRFFAVLTVLFHALFIVSREIVRAGGVNLNGIIELNPFKTIVALTGCFVSLAFLHLAHALAAGMHAMPFPCDYVQGDDQFWHHFRPLCRPINFMKGVWAFGWAGALGALFYSKDLLGVELFGTSIWFIAVGIRLACLLIDEGIFSSCGCSRTNKVRRFFMQMERIYLVSHDAGKDSVLGWKYMRQPVSRVWRYTLFWLALLLVKVIFDLQILTQQENLVIVVQNANLRYAWDSQDLMGIRHPIIVLGSWFMIGSLYAMDSYICFILGAAVVGYCTLRGDGVGVVKHTGYVKQSFLRGVGWSNRTPLADQFVKKMMPLAKTRGVDANSVFRRAWDQFVMSMREQDLISNEEQCRLMYGDAVLGVVNQMPLFLYAGKVKTLIQRAGRVAQLAYTCGTDEDFIASAVPDVATEEAVAEIMRAVPHLLTLLCQSHSAIGYGDPHVGRTIAALFQPRPDQSLRDMVGTLLTADGKSPVTTLRQLAGLIARLCVEFERDGASTRLRGSPLSTLAIDLLRRAYRMWNPAVTDEQIDAAVSGTIGRNSGIVGGVAGVGDPSFAGPMLERLASMAGHSQSTSMVAGAAGMAMGTVVIPAGGDASGVSPVELNPGSTRHGHHQSVIAGSMNIALRALLPPHLHQASAFSGLADTRSVLGIIRLLQEPNEWSGRLDGDGEPRVRERYEALRESARRVFYLLTMDHADGALRVPEAERRLTFFINSLYMDQLPVSESVLEMPSFNVITPHYSEAVIYGKKDFLSVANRQGVSPMVYLKSLHAHEWANFCERLGVKNETQAWKASKDAQGSTVNGEIEVRLWASHRGQTLAKTIHGVMEYVRAIRLLATLQLEIEYAALEDARAAAAAAAGQPYTRASLVQLERDAVQAAQWFTAERFQYLVACQKYFDHGEDDVRRRADIDFLLYTHPLLSVAFYETSVSPFTAKKRLLSVLRKGRADRYRIPLPGNPIADGIAEGKPSNQDNAATYVTGRCVQTLDMNQDAWFEECLKLPNALKMLTVKPATGRPVAVVGLREHIFTHCLSSSAHFMSQQEYLFGTMWQRLMASPLRVRFHYGHPDIWDYTFIKTRGGTAKASSTINVSEDIFAGYTVCLRGGESEHIEFMQVGKGRDVGILQIEVFESKISAGTAISMTTRDSFRVFEGMDLTRLFSYWHSCGGFYISNILIVLAYMSTLYYMGSMALTGLDKAIMASNQVFLLGQVNALQWFVQLGLLSVLPLMVLYGLEYGWLSSIYRTLTMFGSFSPIFFMMEIATKAYFFDNALTFGRSSYMATGRDFVIRHLDFPENFRATAHSHLYLGMEALCLLLLTTAYGSFQSITAYMFFFVTGWLFTFSLLFGAFWFNPFAMEWKAVKGDMRSWWAWLNKEEGTPDSSWNVWFEKEAGSQYSQANIFARVWRVVRVSRFLILATLLVYRLPNASSPIYVGVFVGLALATVVCMQVVHWLFLPCVGAGSSGGARFVRSSLLRGVYFLFVGASVFLAAVTGGSLAGSAFVNAVVAYGICLWWASRVLNIISCWPLADGVRAVHKTFDFQIGAIILLVQAFFALCVPGGSVLHNHLLFSRKYADTVEVVSGTRDVLNKHSKEAAAKFLKLKNLGELQHQGTATTGDVGDAHRHLTAKPRNRWGMPKRRHTERSGLAEYGIEMRPENRIGVRRNLRLRPIDQIGHTPKEGGEAGAEGRPGATDAAAGASAAGTGLTGGSDAGAAGGGTGFGTINIPGLSAAMAAADAPPPAATDAGAATSGSTIAIPGLDAASAGAGGAPRVKKTLREIMSEYSSKPSRAKKEEEGEKKKGKGDGSDSESDDGKKKKGKGGKDAKKGATGKAGSRWPPPKKNGSDSDDDGGGSGLTGVAALRARLEKQAKKKE